MRYVGLDVHYGTSTYCVLGEDGQELQCETVRGHWPKLLERLRTVAGPWTICFEATCGYGYLYRELSRLAKRVVVAHPGQLQEVFSGRYAGRREKGKTIYMHREIMNAPPGMVVDHIDGNAPNNCRSNLRLCTPRQNQCNQVKRIGCISRFKGVYRDERRGKWFVMIRPEDKPIWFGYFDTEIEAARVYDRLAVECFGAFAGLNFPEEWPPERRQTAYAKKETIRAAQKAKAQRAMRRKGKGKKAKGKTKDKAGGS